MGTGLVKLYRDLSKVAKGAIEFKTDKLKLLLSPPPSVDPWLTNAKNKHKGERCFIIATGPSLNSLDLSFLKDEICIGVNGTYLLDNIDLEYFVYVSNYWHKQHIDGIKNVRCKRRFIPEESKEELDSKTPTTWYRKINPKYFSKWKTPLDVPAGFSYKPDRYLYAGGSVVFVCLQLAYYFGFKEVYIVGLDHSYAKDKDSDYKKHGGSYIKMEANNDTHFVPNYFNTSVDAHLDFDAIERGYSLANDVFNRNGRKIYNASAQTKLDIFKRVDYNSLFKK